MTKTSILGREAILGAMKLRKEEVSLDGGNAIVSELSAPDYLDALNSKLVKDEKGEFDGSRFTPLLIIRCVVDGNGARIFSDEDLDAIRNGSTSVLNKLGAAVKRVNGLAGTETKN